MRASALLWLLAATTSSTFAQENVVTAYRQDQIPAELRKEAHVVIRNREDYFNISARDHATHKVHEVYTIMDAEGKSFSQEAVFYSKLSKIVEFHGAVYDADGVLIRRLKPADILDISAISGFSLYEDNRVRFADLSQGSYPYTVEFDYEEEFGFLFYIPEFHLFPRDRVAVQKSTFILTAPKVLAPRYKVINSEASPEVSETSAGHIRYRWSFENQPPQKQEPYSLSVYETSPIILAGPSAFQYEGYKGEMNTWQDFGIWIHQLNKGRDQLPDATRDKIKQLTEGKGFEERIKLVYEFLQQKTRYVSIQIGIGGFQPFEAKVVDETGYGDCKALSNYVVALLNAAGIEANYVLIRAGKNAAPIRADFPSTQFNHAVVAVPRERDTLWLECTSQTNPFGYMGTFTGDREALMITREGAQLVKTPRYPDTGNLQSRSVVIRLDSLGNAKAHARTTYSGLRYEDSGLHFVLNDQFDDQRKWIFRNTQIPNFDVKTFHMSNRKGPIPSAIVDIDLVMKKYASVNGKRLFLIANVMNRGKSVTEGVTQRTKDVWLREGFIERDTIIYQLPEGLYPEFLPNDIKYTSSMGEYEATFRADAGKLIYSRRLYMRKGRYPASAYAELINFQQSINKADQIKIAFLGKT